MRSSDLERMLPPIIDSAKAGDLSAVRELYRRLKREWNWKKRDMTMELKLNGIPLNEAKLWLEGIK